MTNFPLNSIDRLSMLMIHGNTIAAIDRQSKKLKVLMIHGNTIATIDRQSKKLKVPHFHLHRAV